MDYRNEAPQVLLDFLSYHEIVKGHSQKTIDEYYLDLRTFFRYLKLQRGLVEPNTPMSEISIQDIDLNFLASVTKTEVYAYMSFLSRDRIRQQKSHEPEFGLNSASRARKLATLKSLYRYLTVKTGKLQTDPILGIDSPKTRRSLPHYLSLGESEQLLNSVGGRNPERDRCILSVFLNCGLRISELTGLNLKDLTDMQLRVLGKGGRERVVFLNDAAMRAVQAYLAVRPKANTQAFFITERGTRISRSAVHYLVKRHLGEAGLDTEGYSAHKLRHTAATLMLKNGVDVRTLQELLGHEHLNTTEIYTHVESTDLRQAADASPLASFQLREEKEE